VIDTGTRPSRDRIAHRPVTDIGAAGTLNMTDSTPQYRPDAVFIFRSADNAYGDTPNVPPLLETGTQGKSAGPTNAPMSHRAAVAEA